MGLNLFLDWLKEQSSFWPFQKKKEVVEFREDLGWSSYYRILKIEDEKERKEALQNWHDGRTEAGIQRQLKLKFGNGPKV